MIESPTLEVTLVDIDKIVPYANNPRNNTTAVDQVAASLMEYGWRQPIVVDEKNVIVVGHTRLLAAKKIGYKQVPVHIAKGLTEKQIKAYRIADNKTNEFAAWDEKMLSLELSALDNIFTGFTNDEIKKLFDKTKEKNKDPDDVPPQVLGKPISEKGDIWVLDSGTRKHRVMCGSSTDINHVKQLTNGKLMDLMVTDPPYNCDYQSFSERMKERAGIASNRPGHKPIANDKMDNKQFKSFLDDWLKASTPVMKPGGCYYICFADTESINFKQALIDAGMPARLTISWLKNHAVMGQQDYNHQIEPILYGWKPGAAHYFCGDFSQKTLWNYVKDQDLTKLTKEELLDTLQQVQAYTDAWPVDRPSRSDMHPTMKPVKLFTKMIENSSIEHEKVFDPFSGSGTTIIACEDTMREGYAMEFDQHHCDTIVRRWRDYTGKEPLNLRTNKTFTEMSIEGKVDCDLVADNMTNLFNLADMSLAQVKEVITNGN